MSIKRPRGTKDILPDQISKWQYVEQIMREVCKDFGFLEIRTPVFEHTELFSRGVGDATDVVQKEMYTFADKDDRSLTLRPEGTASAVRAFLENGLFGGNLPAKYYYLISCFRYEKPQAGRLREFHQFGIEMFGAESPRADGEIISLACMLFERLGVKNLSLRLNSLGCPECRKEYMKALQAYFESNYEDLCETCRQRFSKNPMRIIDCKNPVCSETAKGAPSVLDFICNPCRGHFERTTTYLTSMGIEYQIDPTIVRGLDYYTRTVFEFVSNEIGAQGTVCGGGRYDGLIQELGGKSMPGLGFAMGIERLLMVMEGQGLFGEEEPRCRIYLAPMGEEMITTVFDIACNLRKRGIGVQMDLMEKSIKAQMKYADKLGAEYVGLLGSDEMEREEITLKNMKTGEQKKVPFTSLVQEIEKEYK
jgi:histidyl-tRNA synthetase